MTDKNFLSNYHSPDDFWDEMMQSGHLRPEYINLVQKLSEESIQSLLEKDKMASELFMHQGITFTVYSDNKGIERIFPFDIIPRIIKAKEWEYIEKGIKQRLTALNMFLLDIYSKKEILRDKIIPASLIATCGEFTREVAGITPPHKIFIHIAGIDLIRGENGQFYILEDNLRTPSGVSYMLENREVTKRIFPGQLTDNNVRMISNYPLILHQNLIALNPKSISNPTVVLLTPGVYNAAYYEHTFLARQMGIPLVEPRDLMVHNHKVYMKTTKGLQQVDVIYRRIDDIFLDPLAFRTDSVLGIPGIISAYRKGNVTLVNAPGNGVADDKAIYSYVPDMIKYYLNEEPIIPNVPTYQMGEKDALEYVFENINNMVIKKTNQSGGYGMLMGNKSTEEEINNYKNEVLKDPRNYIAQPIIKLSTVPCFIDQKFESRHVDLRPFALYGANGIDIVPGGLTRVALKKGSLVVNSSQGGGSKDTWIVDLKN